MERAEAFRALHAGEPFLFPNPWDAGSARVLEALGFRALATTSSGFAFTLGRRDGAATLDDVVEHVRAMSEASALPVAADLENMYDDPATTVSRIAEAGAVGGSIEDYDSAAGELYPLERAVERVTAAVEAARSLEFPFTLTARSENQLHGDRDLDETVARLQAYEAAGADVVFAPGLRSVEEIRAVAGGVSKPLNVLGRPGLTMRAVVEAGAQRISVGGSLTWVAVRALADAAKRLRDDGDFSVLSARVPLDDWFGA